MTSCIGIIAAAAALLDAAEASGKGLSLIHIFVYSGAKYTRIPPKIAAAQTSLF